MMVSIIDRWNSADGGEVVDLGYSKRNRQKSIPVEGTTINEYPRDFFKDKDDPDYIKTLEKEFDDVWEDMNKE